MNTFELKERASSAFDAKFRDRLANAVQNYILNNGKIGHDYYYKCPEGCLFQYHYHPGPLSVALKFGFDYNKHNNFQIAFDNGTDNNTPEAALGLLYRERFIK